MTGSVSVTDLTSPVAKPPEDKTVHRNGFRYKLAPLRGKPDVQDSVCPSQLPATSVGPPIRFTHTSSMLFLFYQMKSAGKLRFGRVPSRTSRPPGKGLIAREDLGVTGSVSVTDLTSPVAELSDDKTVRSTGTVFRYLVSDLRSGFSGPYGRKTVGFFPHRGRH